MKTKEETHHIQTRANAKPIKQSNKRPADTLSGCFKDFKHKAAMPWTTDLPAGAITLQLVIITYIIIIIIILYVK